MDPTLTTYLAQLHFFNAPDITRSISKDLAYSLLEAEELVQDELWRREL